MSYFFCNSEAFALELSRDIDSTIVCYHKVSYIIAGERKEVMSSSYNSEALASELNEEFTLAKYACIVKISFTNASVRKVILCSYNSEVLVYELNEYFDFTLVEATLHYSE